MAMAVRRGGIRRPMYQDNNAPTGYGQQSGQSPYLDREARNVASALGQGAAAAARQGSGGVPIARTQPVGAAQRYEPESSYEPQTPDQWERQPGHPHYGKDPRTVSMRRGSSSGDSDEDTYGEKRPRLEDYKPGSMDAIRGLLGEEPENADGTFSDYQLSRISGSRQGAAGAGAMMPAGPHTMPDGTFMAGDGAMAPEYANFQYEVGARPTDQPYGSTADGIAPASSPSSTLEPMAGGASARYGTDNIPGAENVAWGDTSSLRGFNTAEWGEGGTAGYEDASIKNTFGKIASRYDPRVPNAVQQILDDPDFKQRFPEAQLISHPKGDQIDFGDGNPVDVLINAVEGGSGEAWAFQTGGGGGTATGLASGAAQPSQSAVQSALVGPTVGANESSLQALLDQILLGNSQGQDMYNAYQDVI